MSMTTLDNPLALLTRALRQTGELIAHIRPEQAELPTTCAGWDVRALAGHVIDEVHQFARSTNGEPRTAPIEAGADWAKAFESSADELLAAWRRPGALDRPQRLPPGDVPAQWAVGQQVTELAMHCWDLARSTGQSTDLDPELGAIALAWGQANLKPEFRGDAADGYQVGHEVAVPADAPIYDRLAAFGGRDPR